MLPQGGCREAADTEEKWSVEPRMARAVLRQRGSDPGTEMK